MEKRNKAIVMFVLMGSLLFNDIYAAKESKNFFWEGVGVAAAVVVAGVGACKLLEWCFTETNSQLIARAEREYQKAFQFIDSIGLLESGYRLDRIMILETYPAQYVFSPITAADRRLFFDAVYEPVLYTLARSWFDRGMSSYSCINDISIAKNELQSLLKKLYARIDEKKGTYLDYNETQQLSSMNSMARLIDAYLPHISLLSDYVTLHSGYFNLFESEAYLFKQYDVELRIVGSGSAHYTMIDDLRQSVAWRYSGRKYPFVAFVSAITSDISSLTSTIRSLSCHYTERIRYARSLLDSLEWIKKAVACDGRYAEEMYQIEMERLEHLRIEACLEKARLERARLYAQQEQNRLLAHNNMLQAQLAAQPYQACCDNSISPHINIFMNS